MQYCSRCDIVYDVKECPLCLADKEISALTDEIEALQKEIDSK